jgi:hypothetical protein
MSVALLDFLIEISDPTNLLKFREDPEGFMSGFGLTIMDKAAVRSGKSGWIRLQGSVAGEDVDFDIDSDDPRAKAARLGALIEVEPMVEQHTEESEVVTADPNGLVVGEDGRLYRFVKAA